MNKCVLFGAVLGLQACSLQNTVPTCEHEGQTYAVGSVISENDLSKTTCEEDGVKYVIFKKDPYKLD